MHLYALVVRWRAGRGAVLGEHAAQGLHGNYRDVATQLLASADRASRQQSYLCDKYVPRAVGGQRDSVCLLLRRLLLSCPVDSLVAGVVFLAANWDGSAHALVLPLLVRVQLPLLLPVRGGLRVSVSRSCSVGAQVSAVHASVDWMDRVDSEGIATFRAATDYSDQFAYLDSLCASLLPSLQINVRAVYFGFFGGSKADGRSFLLW